LMSIIAIHNRGVKLSCRTAGDESSRATALLIHGLNTNIAFWHPTLVRALGDSRRLLMYDQRGHGYSDMPPTGYTCSALAEDALAVLDACDVASADVVAHSFGAGVALKLAQLYPDRVRSIVILDGRLRCFQPDVRIGEWSQFSRWAAHFEQSGVHLDPTWELDCTLPLRFEGLDLTGVDGNLAADGFFVPIYSKRAMTKYRRMLTETSALADFRDPTDLTVDDLRGLRQPIALVYGAISPFLPTGDALSEVTSAPLEILEGVGHNFPFNYPQRSLAAIENSSFWTVDRPTIGNC
jgi:pimeloyl-ACP methyl ester carboxylesterase